jgi:hypothetical protein
VRIKGFTDIAGGREARSPRLVAYRAPLQHGRALYLSNYRARTRHRLKGGLPAGAATRWADYDPALRRGRTRVVCCRVGLDGVCLQLSCLLSRRESLRRRWTGAMGSGSPFGARGRVQARRLPPDGWPLDRRTAGQSCR